MAEDLVKLEVTIKYLRELAEKLQEREHNESALEVSTYLIRLLTA